MVLLSINPNFRGFSHVVVFPMVKMVFIGVYSSEIGRPYWTSLVNNICNCLQTDAILSLRLLEFILVLDRHISDRCCWIMVVVNGCLVWIC